MQIILSDLVTLRERGTFTGLMALYIVLYLYLEICSCHLVLGQLVVVSAQSSEVHWRRMGNGMPPVCDPTLTSPSQSVSCSIQEMDILYV